VKSSLEEALGGGGAGGGGAGWRGACGGAVLEELQPSEAPSLLPFLLYSPSYLIEIYLCN
jgi:hypothetical protein